VRLHSYHLSHYRFDTWPELENTGTRIDSDFVPEHADLIQGQRKKQKRLERRLKRGLLMAVGWTLNAAMIYLILVTARLTPDIWDPYDVLGVSRVCSRSCEKAPVGC
jgi:translocation protein SEC63